MNITENQEYLTENTTKLTDKEILAQNIVFFRKKMGFSQTELAKELKYSNKNISKWNSKILQSYKKSNKFLQKTKK